MEKKMETTIYTNYIGFYRGYIVGLRSLGLWGLGFRVWGLGTRI